MNYVNILKLSNNYSQIWGKAKFFEGFFGKQENENQVSGSASEQRRSRRSWSPRGWAGKFRSSERAPQKRWISLHYKQGFAKTALFQRKSAAELQQIEKNLWGPFPTWLEKFMNVCGVHPDYLFYPLSLPYFLGARHSPINQSWNDGSCLESLFLVF